MNKVLLVSCVCALTFFAAESVAQSIHGFVINEVTKAPVIGAKVTYIELATSCMTDTTGRYSADVVPAGIYNVSFEAPQYLKVTRKVILIAPKGGAGTSEIELNVGLYSISSNADTSEGNMVVKYRFPNHSGADIVVTDKNGKAVRKAIDRSRTGGMRTFSWDGRDNYGKFVAAGRYSCKVVSGRLVMIRTLYWKGDDGTAK
ncbi:MAG: carboxypeptidase regulatory-like domain-containing protein [Chitinispirillaceae bacterium]|nr:carboxypeptidase regulatory-like domain-containing protein [Chitinispirillaceae bacterium]